MQSDKLDDITKRMNNAFYNYMNGDLPIDDFISVMSKLDAEQTLEMVRLDEQRIG